MTATSADKSPPLAASRRVIVTRPQPQADEWVARLQALGLDAAALPLLGIAGPADPAPVLAAWDWLAGGPAPGQAPERPAAAMFVSPSAVDRFFAQRPRGLVWPPAVLAAGTGPGTRRALLAAGVPNAAVVTPPEAGGQFDSEALWAVLAPRSAWVGRAVLVLRGEGGRDWLADTLRQQGAQVHFVEAYRRTAPVPDAAGLAVLHEALALPSACCWLFSSSEAVGQLPALAPGADWSAARALATHPRIAAAARRLGMAEVRQIAPEPAAVLAAVRGWASADGAGPAPGGNPA